MKVSDFTNFCVATNVSSQRNKMLPKKSQIQKNASCQATKTLTGCISL